MTTLWLSFTDPNARGFKWRGVAILDVEGVRVVDGESLSHLERLKIGRELERHNIAPGLPRYKYYLLRALLSLGLTAIPQSLYRWLTKAQRLSFAASDVTGDARIGPEHKNRLLLDEALLVSLGSTGRAKE